MAETSFSWNFDAGTLTDVVKTLQLQENARDGSGYGLPLAACLPGSDEPVDPSEQSTKQVAGESEKLLGDSTDKVTFVFVYCEWCKTLHALLRIIILQPKSKYLRNFNDSLNGV